MSHHRRDPDGRTVADDTPIGFVQSLAGDGGADLRGWVACPRNEDPVNVDRCSSCDECASMAVSRDGRVTSLRCFRPPSEEQSRMPAHLGLLAEVPNVADLMTRDVLCVRPDLSLDALMALFAERGLRAVPVVDGEGRLLGSASESDVVAYLHGRAELDSITDEGQGMHQGDGLPRGMHQGDGLPRGMHAVPAVAIVQDAMMPSTIAVPQAMPVTQAAGLMALEGMHRLIVVSRHGEVIGLLSAVDVMAWLGRAGGFASR